MVRKVHKYANGGIVHGAPLSTPAPGSTKRTRPKPGDKDPNYKPKKPAPKQPSKAPAPKKPAPKPKAKPKSGTGSTFRDYRGVDGVVDDAMKGK